MMRFNFMKIMKITSIMDNCTNYVFGDRKKSKYICNN